MPAQNLVIDNGDRYDHVIAAKGKNYALFYVYNSRAFKVDLSKLKFIPKKGTWFKPSNGEMINIADYRNTITATFDPPGEKIDGNDWVLILER